MTEFNSCGNCNKGYYYYNTPYKMAVKCKCLVEWELEARVSVEGKKAHLRPSVYSSPPYYVPKTDYIGEKSRAEMLKVSKYGEEFDSKYKHQSLYIYGPHSSQKTTIAQWIGLHLIMNTEYKVQYILMKTLVDLLTAKGWEDKEETLLDVDGYDLKRIQKADLLIIDEAFDKNKMTVYKSSYQIPYLDQFLRNRIDVMEKPIVFVSNKSPAEMIKDFPSLIDLSHLIDRRITKQGAALEFLDVTTDIKNDFSIGDIFA